MSKILWAKALVPPAGTERSVVPEAFSERMKVAKAAPIPVATLDIKLPDPRAIRSMSRAAALMSHVCLDAAEALKPFLATDPFSVGVYCAVENGPVDVASSKQLAHVSFEEFGEKYKKMRNPKMYLKQLPNLAAAQMGIFLNLMGPMDIYSHSTAGGFQALDQAEFDLENGKVKAALVCTGFSFEDPLLLMKHHALGTKGRILAEGAAAVVLVPSGARVKWENEPLDDPDYYFGIGQQIVTLAKGR